MLNLPEVDWVVGRAASAALKGGKLGRVYSEPTLDSEGREALRIVIVLTGDKDRDLSGDDALNALVRIRRDLQKSGEERFPILEFVTEDELKSNAETES
jgi:hypothetical protein